MKRVKGITFLLVVLLVLGFTVGCQPQQPEEPQEPETPPQNTTPPPTTGNNEEVNYEDGTHTAEGEPDERGWKAMIEITVADGRITEVNYEEENEEGNLKSEDEEYNQRWEEASGVSAPEAYEQLENSLIENQNPEQVDMVTGATSASEKFVELATEALK
ncbi:FMN-binding protein [Alkaliphilus crotonatoxidans]